jgi:hypothetical protein
MIEKPYLGQCLSVTFVILAGFGALTACAQSVTEPSSDSANRHFTEPPPIVSDGRRGFSSRLRHTGPVELRPDHPQRYIVKQGDTPQKVAEVFLKQPWRWPEVWRPRPGKDNPEQLFIGEVIELYYQGDQPRFRPAEGVPTIRLSPEIRVQPIEDIVPTIPRQAISSFLKRSVVSNELAWKEAPKVIGNAEDRILNATGSKIYVNGITSSYPANYRIFRPGNQYRDPLTGQLLGLAGRYVGEATLEEVNTPSVLMLTHVQLEVRAGDRLFPADEEGLESLQFEPRMAPPDTQGQVIALLGDNVLASQYQSLVVNLGEEDGMEPGYMLDIVGTDEVPRQGLLALSAKQVDYQVGSLMLYRVYDGVSYGLVMDMTDTIQVLDRVQSP